jgi:hypothetical protein
MEEAVLYLSRTDEALASARARFNGLRESAKVVKAMAYQRSISSVAAQKEQDAISSAQYREHLNKMQDAEYEYMLLQTKRETETVIIDCWRSLNAARTKGIL